MLEKYYLFTIKFFVNNNMETNKNIHSIT